jgi:integrase
LREHVEVGWRPGEWRDDVWLFTGMVDDPNTATWVCLVSACDRIISRGRLCTLCRRDCRRAGQELERFLVTHVPTPSKLSAADYHLRQGCAVVRDGQRCPRGAVTLGLCTMHHQRWRQHRKRAPEQAFDTWLTTSPVRLPELGDFPACLVPACGRESRTFASRLCELHTGRYRRAVDSRPIAEWAREQPPYLADHQFSLLPLEEPVRWELLFALQQRDARGGRIDPYAVRAAVDRMHVVPGLSLTSEPDLEALLASRRESNINAHLFEFARYLRAAKDEMNGLRPTDRLVWDLVEIGISSDPTALGGTRRRSGLDFGQITQSWLRDLALAWAREQRQSRLLTETIRATIVASGALDQRHDRGTMLSRLGDADATLVTDAINCVVSQRGDQVGYKHKQRLYQRFFALINYGRRCGQLAELPMAFAPLLGRTTPFAGESTEESTAKAIPVEIQRQLDAQLSRLGRGLSYGDLSDEQSHLMFRTAYILLRDTGRRPLEIVTLQTDCLTQDRNGPVLRWNNHKAKRYGRRLPILRSTTDALSAWLAVRSDLPTPTRSKEWLFPAIAERAGQPHMKSAALSRAIRIWVDGLDRLETSEHDDAGHLIPFDRMQIFPYAFRHTFAQRHADNGTPIDVLRELMDHRSIQTTAGYYVVTADRKRAAIDTVGRYAIDRDGGSAPVTDPTRYQMQSVAVPFGNCLEPTNVKAGGQACPVRFQCAGCGFYRPDPSYIPAIEEHLNSLRADRETAMAMDTASYVTDSFTAQINAFEVVLRTMRDRLNSLEPDERARVEHASAVLRRARAGIPLPLAEDRSVTGSARPASVAGQ